MGQNRLHLDFYTDDPEAEVERLLGIGATRHPRTPEPVEDFVVLEDPEGEPLLRYRYTSLEISSA